MSAREVVEEMRFVVREENPERDPDCYFVFIEPVNKLEVKKEVAASEDAEEEVDVCVGMTLAYIDLTGKDAVETDTFDGFVSKKARRDGKGLWFATATLRVCCLCLL